MVYQPTRSFRITLSLFFSMLYFLGAVVWWAKTTNQTEITADTVNDIQLSSDKAIYAIGEPVILTMKNIGSVSIPYQESGCIRFAPVISQGSQTIYEPPVPECAEPEGGFPTLQFAPGQTIVESWSQLYGNFSGKTGQVPPGTYQARTGIGPVSVSTEFTISTNATPTPRQILTPLSGPAPLTVTYTYLGCELGLTQVFPRRLSWGNDSPLVSLGDPGCGKNGSLSQTYLNPGTYIVTATNPTSVGSGPVGTVTVTQGTSPTNKIDLVIARSTITKGEVIAMTITNHTSQSIAVHCFGSHPYFSVSQGNQQILGQAACPATSAPAMAIAPGASQTDQWDQRDDKGELVGPGTYQITVANALAHATISVTISGPLVKQAQTDKSSYKRGELIHFSLMNSGSNPLILSAPCNVVDFSITKDSRLIYQPKLNPAQDCAQATVTIPPQSGQEIGQWNQLDTNGTQVGSGTYTVAIQDAIASFDIQTTTQTQAATNSTSATAGQQPTPQPTITNSSTSSMINSGGQQLTPSISTVTKPSDQPSVTPLRTKFQLVATGGSLGFNLVIAAILSLLTTWLFLRNHLQQE